MATQTGAVADVTATGTYLPASGSNRVVPIFLQFCDDIDDNAVTAVSLGGVAATRIGGVVSPQAGTLWHYVDLWRLVEADGIPTGTPAFAVTFNEVPTTSRIAACTIQDAHQTDFTVTDTDSTASATSLAGALTSLDDSVVVASVDLQNNASNTGITWPANYVEINDRTTGAPAQRVSAAYKNVATGASETIDPSWAVAVGASLFALLVKDVGGAAAVRRNNLMLMGMGR